MTRTPRRPAAPAPLRVTRRLLSEVPAAPYERAIGGAFFASRGFLETWRAMRGRPVVWTAEADGGIAALLPGIEYGAGPAKRLVSLPDGCPGGVLHDPALGDRARFVAPLLEALSRAGYAKIAVFDPAAEAAEHPGFTAERYDTWIVDFDGPSWTPPDRALRSEIRKADREGFEVQRFDWRRHRMGFLALDATTARRHDQRPRYTAALFERLARLAERDPRVVWRYAERRGEPVASQIYFADGDVLVAWYECFDKAFSSLKPHQNMRFHVCRDAIAGGALRLDLGATPPGAAGVRTYKEHWGARPVPRVSQSRWAGLGAVVERARRLKRGPAA